MQCCELLTGRAGIQDRLTNHCPPSATYSGLLPRRRPPTIQWTRGPMEVLPTSGLKAGSRLDPLTNQRVELPVSVSRSLSPLCVKIQSSVVPVSYSAPKVFSHREYGILVIHVLQQWPRHQPHPRRSRQGYRAPSYEQ